MPAGFGYASQPAEVTPQQQLREAQSFGLSIRQLSQLTGVSFGSIQGILSGRTRAPRELTVQRIRDGLSALPTFRSERERTWADDRPLWTGDDLAALTPPPRSDAFKLVVRSPNTSTGLATSDWFMARDLSPLDAAQSIGAHPLVIARVIWAKPRR